MTASSNVTAAIASYIGARLQIPGGAEVPSAQDVQTVVDDINTFLGRLPGEIKSDNWQDDWGALADRPKHLVNGLNKITGQCPKL